MKKSLLTLVALTMVVSAHAATSKPSWRLGSRVFEDQFGLQKTEYMVEQDQKNLVRYPTNPTATANANAALEAKRAEIERQAAALNAVAEKEYNAKKTAADAQKYFWNRGQASVFTPVVASSAPAARPQASAARSNPPAGEPATAPAPAARSKAPEIARDAQAAADFVQENQTPVVTEGDSEALHNATCGTGTALAMTGTLGAAVAYTNPTAQAVLTSAATNVFTIAKGAASAMALVSKEAAALAARSVAAVTTYATPFGKEIINAVMNVTTENASALVAHPVTATAVATAAVAASLAYSPALKSKALKGLKKLAKAANATKNAMLKHKGKIAVAFAVGATVLANTHGVPAMHSHSNTGVNLHQTALPVFGPEITSAQYGTLYDAANFAEYSMADAPVTTWKHAIFGKPVEFVQSFFN